jgi:hypothetical protein
MKIETIFATVVLIVMLTVDVAAHTAETDGITLEYGNRWRVSGKTDNMLTLTHTAKPGKILLSVSKVPAPGSLDDASRRYQEKLRSFGAEIESLPAGKVGGKTTQRFLTRLPKDPDVLALNQIFESNGNLYIATVTASEEDLITYAREALPVLESMKFSGKAASAPDVVAGRAKGIGGKAASLGKGLINKVTSTIKSVFNKVVGFFGFGREETKAVKKTVCNPPYMRLGSKCCLDRNGNSICDKDE